MKIEHRTIQDGVLRITTTDERWYKVGEIFYPSVTFILDSYPKGKGFAQFLKTNGDSADSIAREAAERGSRVHHAIEQLVNTGSVKHDDKFSDGEGNEAELTALEYGAVLSFGEWWSENKPTLLGSEITVINKEERYAGTLDLLLKIGDDVWLIDIKTSKEVYPSHELQVSALKHCTTLEGKELAVTRLGILQVGYRTKKGYKLTEVTDDFDTFLAVKKVWSKEHGAEKPSQKDYPLEIKL